MRLASKLILVLLLMIAMPAWATPTVSNVTAHQRMDGSTIMDIWYDLSDPDHTAPDISVKVSSNGGSSYTITPVSLSGDYGADVPCGKGKHIIWNVGTDLPGAQGANYKISVTATVYVSFSMSPDAPPGNEDKGKDVEPPGFGAYAASESSWRINVRCDDGTGGGQGSSGQIGVYPSSLDGLDTGTGWTPQDRETSFASDIAQTGRYAVGLIPGEWSTTYYKNIQSPASPCTYPKVWDLRIAALPNATGAPIRLQFTTTTTNPSQTVGGQPVWFDLKMVDNKGMGGWGGDAPPNGTTWWIPIPTQANGTVFWSIDSSYDNTGQVWGNLPMLKVSYPSHSAFIDQGYQMQFRMYGSCVWPVQDTEYSNPCPIDNQAGDARVCPPQSWPTSPYDNNAGWNLLRGQLHAHRWQDLCKPWDRSTWSRCVNRKSLSPLELATLYSSYGFDFLAQTDHYEVSGDLDGSPVIWAPHGKELTPSEAFDCVSLSHNLPHVLAIGCDHGTTCDQLMGNVEERKVASVWQRCDNIHARNGLALIAHPTDKGGVYDFSLLEEDLMEVMFAPQRERPDGISLSGGRAGSGEWLWDHTMTDGRMRLWAFTEEDFHPWQGCQIGRAWVGVPGETTDGWNSVETKLKNGNYYSYYVTGAPWPASWPVPALRVSVEGSGKHPVVYAQVSDPRRNRYSMSFITAYGRPRYIIITDDNDPRSYACVGNEGYVRVKVEQELPGGRKLYMLSQPVFVNADGPRGTSHVSTMSTSPELILRYLRPEEFPASLPPSGYVGHPYDVSAAEGIVPPGAVLSLSFEDADLSSIGRTEHLALFRYDQSQLAWLKIGGTIDLGSSTVETSVTVLGTYTISADLPSDTAPPDIAIRGPASGATIGANTVVTASTGDDLGAYQVSFYMNEHLLATDTEAMDGWSVSLPYADYCTGNWTLKAVAEDLAGNQGTTQMPIHIQSSTPRPAVTISSPSPGSTVSGTLTASGTCGDDVAVAAVTLYANDVLVGYGELDGSGGWSAEIDTTYLADGPRTLKAVEEDYPGNEATASVSFIVGSAGPVHSPGDAKKLSDGDPVKIGNVVVIADKSLGGDGVYVEALDRSSGMKLLTDTNPHVGDLLSVAGVMATENAERQINATDIVINSSGHELPRPLGTSGRASVIGLTNTGLLVKTWGNATQIGDGYLYVDDGSGLMDGTSTNAQENIGIRVICDSAGLTVGEPYIVTGISSSFDSGGGSARCILTRTSSDIQPAHTAAVPVFSPDGGTFSGSVSVTVTCPTAGAVIRYTTNGVDPTESSPIVASGGTVLVNPPMTLKARAWRAGWNPSAVKTSTFDARMTAATPTFIPAGGTYNFEQSVTVSSATPGATIRYTTNGLDPTESDPVVQSGQSVLVDHSLTLKAKAWKASMDPSGVKSATYQLIAATPTFSVVGGTFGSELSVTVSCATPGATIRYTTNGADPTESDPAVQSGQSVLVDRSLTLKARAWKGSMDPSGVKSATYQLVVATPTFSVAGGAYNSEQSVTVSSATPGATIRYTTNGLDPTESDPAVQSGQSVLVERSLTLKAKAWKGSMDSSSVKSATYQLVVATPTFTPDAGEYLANVSVVIGCATPDATIRYTLDGRDPTETDLVVPSGGSIEVNVDPSTTLKARAWEGSLEPSAIKSAVYSKSEYVSGEMVPIPAGNFLMGTPEDYTGSHWYDEHPEHSVYLSDYWIGKYEVTRGEYRRFVDAGGYLNPAYWSSSGWTWRVANDRTEPLYWDTIQVWGGQTFTQTERHPVVGVTYYEAEAFCAWAGGRLPTEAEWEKAARWIGDLSSVYPWGDDWDAEKCNNWNDHSMAGGGYARSQSAPVGRYPNGLSPYGLHDMSGNVWEWCKDWYGSSYYSQVPTGGWSDPQGPTSGSYHVLRGGSWGNYDTSYYRCAFRSFNNPYGCSNHLGFRLVR